VTAKKKSRKLTPSERRALRFMLDLALKQWRARKRVGSAA
jgi:hypothetical protein